MLLRVSILLCAVVFVHSCFAGLVPESALIGAWQPSAKDMAPPHGMGTITYRPDHTCTDQSYGEDGASFAHGTWRLDGRELTVRYRDIVVHERILSASRNQLRTRFAINGRVTIFTYTRVKPER
jgi:hypothetical protein